MPATAEPPETLTVLVAPADCIIQLAGLEKSTSLKVSKAITGS